MLGFTVLIAFALTFGDIRQRLMGRLNVPKPSLRPSTDVPSIINASTGKTVDGDKAHHLLPQRRLCHHCNLFKIVYYNALFIGIDVHKETFSLCCYDMQQDILFRAQRRGSRLCADPQLFKCSAKGIGKDVQVACSYEAGCLGFALYHKLTRHGVN